MFIFLLNSAYDKYVRFYPGGDYLLESPTENLGEQKVKIKKQQSSEYATHRKHSIIQNLWDSNYFLVSVPHRLKNV